MLRSRLGRMKTLGDAVRKSKEQREHGYKVGQYDQHGQKIENMEQAKGYTGDVYVTQDEAVDRRYSEGKDLGKRRASVFGNARANIFGN